MTASRLLLSTSSSMDFWFCIYLPLLFLTLYVFTHHILHKLQNLPPTPFPTLPVIGHLNLLRKPLHQRLSQISEKYGPVVFLWIGSRPVLLISSPSAAEECFTKNDVIFANRPRFLVGKILGCNYTSLVWAPNGDHWRNLRRISSLELLSSHRLQILSHVWVDEVKALILDLKGVSLSDSGQPVDLRSFFVEFTFNVLMRMIGGKKYYGKHLENSDESSRFEEMIYETARVGGETLGDFMPFINWFALNKGMEKKLMAIHVKRHQFMQDLIEYHRESMSGDSLIVLDDRTKKTMIRVLLSLHETDPDYYSDEMIRSLMLVLLQAGTDTTVAILEWAMSHLLNSPQLLKRAQQEIYNLVGEDRLINDSDLSELPYLNNIINETIRIHPTFPITLPHESSEECIIGGYRIPPGTTLLVNTKAIHMDPKFWVHPEKFDPERFIGVHPRSKADGFKFMPFGAGRRKCPGEGFAMQTIGLVLGSLIQCFDWERVSEEMVDMTEGTAVTASKAEPLVGKCRLRPTMADFLS